MNAARRLCTARPAHEKMDRAAQPVLAQLALWARRDASATPTIGNA